MDNIYKIIEKKFGDRVKNYRQKWNQVVSKKEMFEYSLHLNFELISGCNLNCEYCIHSLSSKKTRKIISFNKYTEIIDEGIKNNLYSIELNGLNEPLLQKDIEKYIKYAKDAGVLIISLHTNATLLNEKMIISLMKSGLTLLIFSVDAFKKETYEKMRKGANYEKTIENINNFLRIKKEMGSDIPLSKMAFIKNKMNQNELIEYTNFWKDKVDAISTSHFCNPFEGEYNYEEIEKKYRLDDFNIFPCTEPYQRLFISSNGIVYPCCSFFGQEFPVGSIYKNSIKDIWNGKKMEKIRRLVNSNENKQLSFCVKCRNSMRGAK